MRSAARLKMGYYPLPGSEGKKLRALLSFAGPASVIDPSVGQGTALEFVTIDAPVRRYGVELDAERARIASLKGIATIQGNTFDAIVKPESFSLLYLNPPYDSEIGTIANRRMDVVFLEHTYRWLRMEGILILVIPFERLQDCIGILSSHFASLGLFRLTDPNSVQYRQIAVFGVGAITAAVHEKATFSLTFPDGSTKEVSLGEHASCYKGAVMVPGRKHPVRHLVAVSHELHSNGTSGRTLLLRYRRLTSAGSVRMCR